MRWKCKTASQLFFPINFPFVVTNSNAALTCEFNFFHNKNVKKIYFKGSYKGMKTSRPPSAS